MLNLQEVFTPFGGIDDACCGRDNLGVTGKLRWSESCSGGPRDRSAYWNIRRKSYPVEPVLYPAIRRLMIESRQRMCSSGWARVVMKRQAKRVCTDVGEDIISFDAEQRSSRGFHSRKSAYVIQRDKAGGPFAHGCHTNAPSRPCAPWNCHLPAGPAQHWTVRRHFDSTAACKRQPRTRRLYSRSPQSM
jgi:hypothetical protein